jgi:hypothetical protein
MFKEVLMGTQITLTIPHNVYQQAEDVAKSTNRPVTEILTETILSAFPPLHVNKQRAAMQQEVAAFETKYPGLWKQYPHHYVAIYQGIIIDHDTDELTLVQRIDIDYPESVVLIRQVLPQLPQPLIFRSPRFVGSQ